MKSFKNNYHLFLLSIFFVYSPVQSIVPETIATTTLLKCGGAAVAAVFGKQCLSVATEKVSFFNSTHLDLVPQASYSEEYVSYEKPKNVSSKITVAPKLELKLFAKIKDAVSLVQKDLFHQSFWQGGESSSFSQANNGYWSQTNVNAQQARGFFPKVNNYYYQSNKGDFWKGVAAGSFVTGTTFFYLTVKFKKD